VINKNTKNMAKEITPKVNNKAIDISHLPDAM
jgi:hypothetical protein